MQRSVICPGSFDPFTLGHKAIIDKALLMFDKVIIAVGYNISKDGYFSVEKRVEIIKKVYRNNENVEVVAYSGITADYCRQNDIRFIVRGIRNVADYQFETTVARVNKQLNSDLETIFIPTPADLEHVSSSLIRELMSHNSDISKFIPDCIDDTDLK